MQVEVVKIVRLAVEPALLAVEQAELVVFDIAGIGEFAEFDELGSLVLDPVLHCVLCEE